MKAHFFSALIFIIFSTGILLLNFLHRDTAYIQRPASTFYTYAMGNIEDYHQYMYLIKLGREGHILFHNAFSEERMDDVLLQPIYNLAGIISRPFSISLYDTYFGMHILSLLMLFTGIYMLINRIFSRELSRITATVLYFSSTGFWWFSKATDHSIQKFYLPNFNFDLFLKYHVVPPHHNIAISLFIMVILLFGLSDKRKWILAGFISLLLGFLHPYILFILLVIHTLDVPLEWVINRKITYDSLHKISILIVSTISLIVYYLYICLYVLQTEIGTKGITSYLARVETANEYFMSLGPVFALSTVLFILYYKMAKRFILRILILWAYVPVVLFFLPDLHLPVNTWRLFQIYQHIPLSLLSALAITRVTKSRTIQSGILLMLCAIACWYGLTNYIWTYKASLTPGSEIVYNVQIPIPIIDMFTFLRTHSKEHSVILAGSTISNLVPEFTWNHVIIGHNGNNRNFLNKQKDIWIFLSGNIPIPDVRSFLRKYHVSYIIFGVDAPKFSDTPYTTLPYLKEMYSYQNLFSIIQVL